MFAECANRIIAETVASIAGMSEECNVKDSISPNDHIEYVASTPSTTPENTAKKRNDQVCVDPKLSVEANPPAEISRVGNSGDLSSPPVSHARLEQKVSEKETNVSPMSPSVESKKSTKITSDEDDDWGGFLSNFEDEALVNIRVTRGSTKGKGKATPVGNVALVHLDSVSFHSEEGASLWKYVVKHKIVDEKEISDSTQECLDLIDLLLEAGLDKTLLCLGLFYP